MASSWQFPRWRRVLMQGVLWLVFMAMLGLAALVNHQVRKALVVPLGESISLDPIELRLPENWQTIAANDIDSRAIRAQEPGRYGRELLVRLLRVGESMSAKEFFGWLRLQAEIPTNPSGDSSITIAGQPGVLFSYTLDAQVSGGVLRKKRLIAAAIFPQGFALVIDLIGSNDIDPTDTALINDVVASVKVPDTGEADSHETTFNLPYGIQLKVPDGAGVARQDDSLVTERQLSFGAADNRTSIQITSLMFFPGASDDAVRGVLIARDPGWASAKVTSIAQGHWQLVRGEDESKATAMLHARPDGRSLLALIYSKDIAQAIEVWNSIVTTAIYGDSLDFTRLLSTGATVATSLSQQGLDELVSESTSNEWWQWIRSKPETIVGWTHVQYDPASPRHLLRESRWLSSGHAMQFVEEAQTSVDLREYTCRLQHSRSDDAGEGGFDPIMSRESLLRQGKVTMTTKSPFAQGRYEGAAPPQFMPGAWLPQLLGRANPAPMVLTTDIFPGREHQPVLEPHVLVIEPTTEHPRTLAGESAPMRCLRITLNGAGQASRWYFNARGELEMIDLPDGLTRVRCNESKIRFDFAKDPRMLPAARTF